MQIEQIVSILKWTAIGTAIPALMFLVVALVKRAQTPPKKLKRYIEALTPPPPPPPEQPVDYSKMKRVTSLAVPEDVAVRLDQLFSGWDTKTLPGWDSSRSS